MPTIPASKTTLTRRPLGFLLALPALFLLACPPTVKDSEPTDDSDADGDGFVASEDCNDEDAAVNPDATEVCGGADEDCDGLTDDADDSVTGTSTFYADADSDGYGSGAGSDSCVAGAGQVADATDCNDGDAAVNPGASEVCGGADEDCDGLTDDADDSVTGTTTYYVDADGDSYGNVATASDSCVAGVGQITDATDCNDGDAAVNPAATEVCGGADEDCDGLTDDADDSVTGTSTFYADTDGDGYGNVAAASASCVAGAGQSSDTTDCDDSDAAVNPAATEVCGGADEDCDGLTDDADDSVTGTSTYYTDADGDGYGSGAGSDSCVAGAGQVGSATDCDDGNVAVNPAATEVCGGADEDCDGLTDDADDSVTGTSTYYSDTDGDGYGNAAAPVQVCIVTAGLVTDSTDADDTDADAWLTPDTYVGDLTSNFETFCYGYGERHVQGNVVLSLATQTQVDSLTCLTSVTGYFTIENSTLTNLDGLSGLQVVDHYLFLRNNDALTDVDGLSSLSEVGGDFYLDLHDGLTNVDGLSSLTSVGGLFAISENPALTNVEGLSSLTSVGAYFSIYNNDALTDVDGLANLTTVTEYLSIGYNDALTNLGGLSGLSSVGVNLTVIYNTVLCDSSINTLLAQIVSTGFTGPTNIVGNNSGC